MIIIALLFRHNWYKISSIHIFLKHYVKCKQLWSGFELLSISHDVNNYLPELDSRSQYDNRLVGFYDISAFLGYLMPNPFFYK